MHHHSRPHPAFHLVQRSDFSSTRWKSLGTRLYWNFHYEPGFSSSCCTLLPNRQKPNNLLKLGQGLTGGLTMFNYVMWAPKTPRTFTSPARTHTKDKAHKELPNGICPSPRPIMAETQDPYGNCGPSARRTEAGSSTRRSTDYAPHCGVSTQSPSCTSVELGTASGLVLP